METTWHVFHFVNLAGIIGLLVFIFNQHKTIIKMKDRMNKVWFEYCKEHKIPYDSVDDDKAYFFNHDDIHTSE